MTNLLLLKYLGSEWVVLNGYGFYGLELVENAIRLAKQEGAFVSMDLASFEVVQNFRMACCASGAVVRALGSEVNPKSWQWTYQQIEEVDGAKVAVSHSVDEDRPSCDHVELIAIQEFKSIQHCTVHLPIAHRSDSSPSTR
eukprot:Gb_41175 [translate_table: standard]